MRELEAVDEFSGVVGIKHGDRELSGAYGYASRAWNVRTTVETRFDTASITKLFTAVATLQLVERGAFGLETPVTEYLALDGTGISPAITPYHLLTHTSGIGDDADEEAGERYEDCFASGPTTRSSRRRTSSRSSSASHPTSRRARAAATATSAMCCSVS